tara:strand:+ start:317 stop:1318 length:1002 start_codon:yes stop_codon:yes gene_type:complete
MNKSASGKIYIAGHKGMVGSAIYRNLLSKGIDESDIIIRDSKELNLINQIEVDNFFKDNTISQVYLAAAKVGGIHANSSFPAEFIYKNLMIQSNVIHAAFKNGVKKLLFLGSSCVYPKKVSQPISEDKLLSGYLEETNEPYAIAKIAGIKTCESYNRQYSKSHQIDYRSVMPCNLYGPGDNYDSLNSHVIPALIRKFHEGKINKKSHVVLWGTGQPRREFLHVDDMADASVFTMNMEYKKYRSITNDFVSHLNVGYGEDISINELALIIKSITEFEGDIEYNQNKPDGTLLKLTDTTLINSLGWKAKIDLREGLRLTYEVFKEEYSMEMNSHD